MSVVSRRRAGTASHLRSAHRSGGGHRRVQSRWSAWWPLRPTTAAYSYGRPTPAPWSLELTGLAGLPGQLSWHPDWNRARSRQRRWGHPGLRRHPAGQPRGAHDRHRIGGSSSRRQPRRRSDRDDRRRPDGPGLLRPNRCPDRSAPADGSEAAGSGPGLDTVPDEDIRFSPDGGVLAVGNDRGVVLWEVEGADRAHEARRPDGAGARPRLEQRRRAVSDRRPRRDGADLVDRDRRSSRIRRWGRGPQLRHLRASSSISCSRVDGSGWVERWSATPGERLRLLDSPAGTRASSQPHRSSSPDGSMFASRTTGRRLSVPAGQRYARGAHACGNQTTWWSSTLSFSPDSRLLATATERGSSDHLGYAGRRTAAVTRRPHRAGRQRRIRARRQDRGDGRRGRHRTPPSGRRAGPRRARPIPSDPPVQRAGVHPVPTRERPLSSAGERALTRSR